MAIMAEEVAKRSLILAFVMRSANNANLCLLLGPPPEFTLDTSHV